MLGVIVLVCSSATAQQKPKDMIFPSGRKITILAVQQVEAKDASGRFGSALVLQYETKLKIRDAGRLSKEVDEIWPWLKVDVDHRKLAEAIIVVDSPGATSEKTFSFKKQPDGTWSRRNPDFN